MLLRGSMKQSRRLAEVQKHEKGCQFERHRARGTVPGHSQRKGSAGGCDRKGLLGLLDVGLPVP